MLNHKEKPTILFMGTPEFALPALQALKDHDFPLLGVVTQPDRPRGRGKQPTPGPVKTLAQEWGLPVYQPERLRGAFVQVIRELAPEMVVVAAFGQMIPSEILRLPRWGCLNIHPSLLPKYRGAAPITRAIMAGETKTGVTIMILNEEMDGGPLLLQEETPLSPTETGGELSRRLAVLGGQLLVRAIEGLLRKDLTFQEQDPAFATLAPKVVKEEGRIDWNAGSQKIVNHIRALAPRPGAYTSCRGRQLKILRAEAVLAPHQEKPGEMTVVAGGLRVAAGDGYVNLLSLQWENRNVLSVKDFLSGFRSEGKTLLE
jgi:methionyl-tRNA formyltransferase